MAKFNLPLTVEVSVESLPSAKDGKTTEYFKVNVTVERIGDALSVSTFQDAMSIKAPVVEYRNKKICFGARYPLVLHPENGELVPDVENPLTINNSFPSAMLKAYRISVSKALRATEFGADIARELRRARLGAMEAELAAAVAEHEANARRIEALEADRAALEASLTAPEENEATPDVASNG